MTTNERRVGEGMTPEYPPYSADELLKPIDWCFFVRTPGATTCGGHFGSLGEKLACRVCVMQQAMALEIAREKAWEKWDRERRLDLTKQRARA